MSMWKSGLLLGFPEPLVKVALELASCRASTANLERSFSTLRHVYGGLRTQLGVSKAGKLAFLYRYFNHHLTLPEGSDEE